MSYKSKYHLAVRERDRPNPGFFQTLKTHIKMDLFSNIPQPETPEQENEMQHQEHEQEQTETKDKDGNSVFCKTRFDTRKQLNRGSKIISDAMISRDGITIEYLEALGMPIFKYKTQITLHGIYNGHVDRVGTYQYKHIIQNQNKSLGIKYNAIDYAKKKSIYKMLVNVKGYRTIENSTEFYAEKWSNFTTDKAKLAEFYLQAKQEVERINTNLFYGTAKAFVTGIQFIGYAAVIRIEINAIYEQNVNACIENITGMTIAECEQYIADIKAKVEEERKAQEEARQKEAEAIAELRKPVIDELNRFLKEEKNMVCVKTNIGLMPLNTVFYTFDFSKFKEHQHHINPKANVLTKEGNQKYPRLIETYFRTEDESNNWKQFFTPEAMLEHEAKLKSDRYGSKKEPKTVIKFFIDREKWETHKERRDNANASKNSQSDSPLDNAGLTAIQYSDKSILIIANDATRPFAAQLSKIGKYGKWFKVNGANTAGWICSAKNQTAINILNNTPAAN